MDDILAGGARAALNLEATGSPQQRELPGMAGSGWNFGGLWHCPEMRVTQEK
jgi:hypothetical protein